MSAAVLSTTSDTPLPLRATSEAAHQELHQRIEPLEQTIEELREHAVPAGIGHNELAGLLSDIELDNVAGTLAAWKSSQPTEPFSPPADIAATALQFKTLGQRIKDYIAKQGDNFVSEAVKTAGKEAGKWAIRGPLIALFADRLMAVAEAALTWARSLGAPI